MISQYLQSLKLPDAPGVYFFKKGKRILYIGKATSLRDRTRSYFAKDLIDTRGERIVAMVEEADSLLHIETDSVLEALILEAYQIKKHQPPYNVLSKDDRSFSYVVITDEDYPRVLIRRGRELEKGAEGLKVKESFGPFISGMQLKAALKIIRRIFPYRDTCTPAAELPAGKKPRSCFNAHLGLCPGVCTGAISASDYRKNIRNIALFFSGKKHSIISALEKEMKALAKNQKFEEADAIKRKIFALEHVHDVSLLTRDIAWPGETAQKAEGARPFRIEAYDIAHLSGKETVGVMVVVESGEVNKSQYRKFKIRGAGMDSVNDIANLKEVLIRRMGHAEWPLPDLIVVDGSTAQINAANAVLADKGFPIEIAAVVKDERHKPRDVIGKKSLVEKRKREIVLANAEAHRFAIAYHRLLRRRRLK